MAAPSLARPSPDASAELVPVALQERVALLDVLRGFCLFGVLWSNLSSDYAINAPATSLDHALSWIVNWLVYDRFYSMLAFLFGIGFAIQITRAADRGQDVRPLFVRRMAVLLAFGVVHGMLIWSGDVLTTYAVAGFFLVLFWRLSARKLLIAAAIVWQVLPRVSARVFLILKLRPHPIPREQVMSVLTHGTWAQAVALNARQYLHGHWGLWSLSLGAADSLALFIFGLWAARANVVGRFTTGRRISIYWALLGALACWGAASYLHSLIPHSWFQPDSADFSTNWREVRFWLPPQTLISFTWDCAVLPNSAVYALLFALAMSFGAAARRLQPLAALGRMTLTTYLTQSLVCTTLFRHWGFGLIGRVNYTGILAVTVLLFSLQIAFSVWWLNRYRFGPAEWL